VGESLTISNNDSLTTLTGLLNITSVNNNLRIYNNDVLTSLNGLNNITSVGWGLKVEQNDTLTNLSGLKNITSVNGIDLIGNAALTNLSELYKINISGSYSYLNIVANDTLCMETAFAFEARLRRNGFTRTAFISNNNGTTCPPEIYNVTTNQGPDGALIPLEDLKTFSLPSEQINWIINDPDAEPEPGEEWEWTLGIAHSYVSYWTEDMGGYSPETELILNNDVAGYFARWKWVSPVLYLPEDGWYWIKLIAEDMDGNRSETAYTIIVDTSGIDSDNDGIPNPSDNCIDNCNTQQLDADGDGVGDVCDDTPGCGGCGLPECEPEC
jgi:hypothetical protein